MLCYERQREEEGLRSEEGYITDRGMRKLCRDGSTSSSYTDNLFVPTDLCYGLKKAPIRLQTEYRLKITGIP